MKVAVMTDIKKLEMCERDIPVCEPHQALVKLECVGICGSDVHYYERGRIGDFIVETPFVLGHECSGVVVAVGEDVTDLAVGTRVAIEPGIPCNTCEYCHKGLYNLCDEMTFFATPPIDGVFCEYVAHDAKFCFPLPDSLDAEQGALIEPLAVGIHAAMQGGATLGQTAVVTGGGCIGLVTGLALKSMGVSKVIVADIEPTRLELAKNVCADEVINSKTQNLAEEILGLTGGKGPDLCVDTSGNENVVSTLIETAKKGTNIVLVGYSSKERSALPIDIMLNKELSLKSIFRYRNAYPIAINAVASGKIDVKSIVTNRCTLDNLEEALDECINNKSCVIKYLVNID